MTNDSSDSGKRLLILLPWVRLSEPIVCAGVRFMKLSAVLRETSSERKVCRQVLAIAREFRLSPIRRDHDCAVVTRVAYPYSVENGEYWKEIAEATHILAVSNLARNEYGRDRVYANSSLFELVGQRFVVGQHSSAFSARRRDGSSTDFGYNYADLRTLAPAWVRQCRGYRHDENFMRGVERLAEKRPQTAKRLQIAFEWLLASFTDGPSQRLDFEVAALSAAFEQSQVEQMRSTRLVEALSSTETHKPTKADSGAISMWYSAFRRKRDKILHGSMKKRPDDEQLGLDLLIGAEVLISYWKSVLASEGVYNWTAEDRDRLGRAANVVEKRDVSAWSDIISIRTRMALEDPDVLRVLYPNTDWDRET